MEILNIIPFTDTKFLEEIKKFTRIKTIKAGDAFISSGDKIVFVPIVLKGALRIIRQGDDKEIFLYHLHPGQTCAMAINCCQGTRCDGSSKKVCTPCKPIGETCASSAECCDSECFDGKCSCCAAVDGDDFKKTHLCCAYPQALMDVPDSKLGPGFKRCCVYGVDCPGDPLGPPAVVDGGYRLSSPPICAAS